ncbi:uncharacterized protein PGTG_20409, partial [Puccinia graminis f. sp. tritici CRL 75-36-700-3]
ALSVQTISDKNPKAPHVQSGTKSMRRHVVVLTWLNTLKSTMPNLLQITNGDTETSETSQVGVNPSEIPTGDSLDELRKIIIDMIMSYTIFQEHSQDQFNPCKKKKTNNSKSQAVALDNTGEDHKSLASIESRHNHFPFISFLLSGARGIFTATRDHRQYTISDSIEVLHFIQEIHSRSQDKSSAEEDIWANLGNYICQILLSVHENQDDVTKIIIPTRHNLAKCVAHDYINYTTKDSNLFNIPPTPRLQ